jgi:hypothetical protein
VCTHSSRFAVALAIEQFAALFGKRLILLLRLLLQDS